MKSKTLFLTVLLTAALSACLLADDNRLIFTEFGISYASVIAPPVLANKTTGVYDTAAFDIKVGADILKWADIYAGGDFMYYTVRDYLPSLGWVKNYTFYPIYGGIRTNICPDWSFYPGLFFELGKAISSYGSVKETNTQSFGPIYTPLNYAWLGTYYNFGFDLNMKVSDIGIISIKIDRPAISSGGTNLGEIHIYRVGLAWKMLY
jgi:hypothetical protein